MSLLSGCINVASTALVDAGIDYVGIISGGAVALARDRSSDSVVVRPYLDPSPQEYPDIVASCVVAYISSREELTETWIKGGLLPSFDAARDSSKDVEILIQSSCQAAIATSELIVGAFQGSSDSP